MFSFWGFWNFCFQFVSFGTFCFLGVLIFSTLQFGSRFSRSRSWWSSVPVSSSSQQPRLFPLSSDTTTKREHRFHQLCWNFPVKGDLLAVFLPHNKEGVHELPLCFCIVFHSLVWTSKYGVFGILEKRRNQNYRPSASRQSGEKDEWRRANFLPSIRRDPASSGISVRQEGEIDKASVITLFQMMCPSVTRTIARIQERTLLSGRHG